MIGPVPSYFLPYFPGEVASEKVMVILVPTGNGRCVYQSVLLPRNGPLPYIQMQKQVADILGAFRAQELLTTFSGIPTSIGGLFLTADATLASPEPSESSPGRHLHSLSTTRDDSIPTSQPNPPLG
jgi:hypothetical protein